MKQLVVLSGKGGTGKTFVTANLALLFGDIIAVDADVDAANMNLILDGTEQKQELFYAGHEAYIEQDLCTSCGVCQEKCPFDAVVNRDGVYRINHLVCEGCTVCSANCPADAVRLTKKISGRWYVSHFNNGKSLFHADLFPGQDNSGKLVSVLRRQAEEFAGKNKKDLILIDGPPGIACPAMAAMTNTDMALFVTEPTASAIEDLKRLIKLSESFNYQKAAVINKAGVNEEKEAEIMALCESSGIPVLASIPFSANIPLSIVHPGAYTEQYNDEVADALSKLYNDVKKAAEEL